MKPNHTQALAILDHLNARSGRHFTPLKAHIKFILACLSETNGDIDGIKQMIDRQVAKWKGTEMEYYLRPATLFNATKFANYYDDRNQPVECRVIRTGYLRPNPVRDVADQRNQLVVGGTNPVRHATTGPNPWDRMAAQSFSSR